MATAGACREVQRGDPRWRRRSGCCHVRLAQVQKEATDQDRVQPCMNGSVKETKEGTGVDVRIGENGAEVVKGQAE